ncbi:MAG: hypothetical protein J3R72DRAFT_250675 [Linnemannia gamsii]|nr:MAG: hypothetical protein J3R72DRAFT_250675 [Linnemannia gamsii]
MKNSTQSQEHGHREPQEEDQRHLPPPHPTCDNDSGDLSSPLHQHQQNQFHNRIGNVGQRFLRHFDYAFLLDRSLHQFDNSRDTTNSASGLSPAAEAYLRHYYSQQHQLSQQGKEQQQAGLFEVSPVLRRRTTVDESGRRPEVRIGGLPPLLPLESLSPELLQGRGSSSPLADLRFDDVMVDVERLARSFVVVEGEGDDDDGEGEVSEGGEQQQQPSHGPRLPRQQSNPSIEQHSRLQSGEVGDETNHARRMDNASTSPAITATSNISGRWSAFSLLPLSYRPTTTTTIVESRNVSFAATAAATTAATTAASRSSTTTTTALGYCDSADNEQAAEELEVEEQRYLDSERQRANDQVAIWPSTSSTGDSDKTQGIRGNQQEQQTNLTQDNDLCANALSFLLFPLPLVHFRLSRRHHLLFIPVICSFFSNPCATFAIVLFALQPSLLFSWVA